MNFLYPQSFLIFRGGKGTKRRSYELMEMTGDPDYFPEQIANYRKPE